MSDIPMVGTMFKSLLGDDDATPDIPRPTPAIPMADEAAIRRERRRRLALEQRQGYAATLLSGRDNE